MSVGDPYPGGYPWWGATTWPPRYEETMPTMPEELYSSARVRRIRRTFYSQEPIARLADEVAGLRDDIEALKLRIEENNHA